MRRILLIAAVLCIGVEELALHSHRGIVWDRSTQLSLAPCEDLALIYFGTAYDAYIVGTLQQRIVCEADTQHFVLIDALAGLMTWGHAQGHDIGITDATPSHFKPVGLLANHSTYYHDGGREGGIIRSDVLFHNDFVLLFNFEYKCSQKMRRISGNGVIFVQNKL